MQFIRNISELNCSYKRYFNANSWSLNDIQTLAISDFRIFGLQTYFGLEPNQTLFRDHSHADDHIEVDGQSNP